VKQIPKFELNEKKVDFSNLFLGISVIEILETKFWWFGMWSVPFLSQYSGTN
jgi:hypothetical protein